MYYYAETDANGFVSDPGLWRKCRADTLSGAKREASHKRGFQGTSLHIGVRTPDGIRTVAVKRDDPINMNRKGHWEDIPDGGVMEPESGPRSMM